MEIMLFAVALLATTIGAISGLGGGVIIKPVLDATGTFDAATAGLLSSFTVLSMAVVSSFRQYRLGVKLEGKRTLLISLGSVLGGVAGKSLFSFICGVFGSGHRVTALQSALLALLLSLVLLYLMKRNVVSFHIKNRAVILTAGFVLGMTAAFLGIGGGPLNVAVLSLLFSMDGKAAAVHSVIIILFSQIAKIFAITLDTGLSSFNLFPLLFLIPGGIIGGLAGAALNRRVESDFVQTLFKAVVAVIIMLNLYNLRIALN